jgi:hypothetical protein
MAYYIKKNPFYMNYPAMLPALIVACIAMCLSCVKYSRVTNMLVHQVHMDPTGTELTFIYQNQFFRRFRNDKPEQTIMIGELHDPPQGPEFKPLEGDLFPTYYPLDNVYDERRGSYFWRKYYIT